MTRISNLLGADAAPRLGKLVRRAREMGDLASCLRAALPESAAPELLAANVRDDGTLVVVCSSSSWAARLRFESDRLLAAAAAAGIRANRLQVSVARGQTPATR